MSGIGDGYFIPDAYFVPDAYLHPWRGSRLDPGRGSKLDTVMIFTSIIRYRCIKYQNTGSAEMDTSSSPAIPDSGHGLAQARLS